ncbi:hypothetical protein LEMLEM_LOCUS13941 [Lemmus lemmus]
MGFTTSVPASGA